VITHRPRNANLCSNSHDSQQLSLALTDRGASLLDQDVEMGSPRFDPSGSPPLSQHPAHDTGPSMEHDYEYDMTKKFVKHPDVGNT